MAPKAGVKCIEEGVLFEYPTARHGTVLLYATQNVAKVGNEQLDLDFALAAYLRSHA